MLTDDLIKHAACPQCLCGRLPSYPHLSRPSDNCMRQCTAGLPHNLGSITPDISPLRSYYCPYDNSGISHRATIDRHVPFGLTVEMVWSNGGLHIDTSYNIAIDIPSLM